MVASETLETRDHVVDLGVEGKIILKYVWKLPTNALLLISLLFRSVAPTCFGTYVSSFGSFSLPAELEADLGVWLLKSCVARGCVFVRRPATHKHTTLRYEAYPCYIRTQVRTVQ
jgi:hypothetical protein